MSARRRGEAEMRRAIAYWRDVVVPEREAEAARLRQLATKSVDDLVIDPCPAYPQGTVAHPRANILDAAHRCHVAAITWAAHADLVEYRWDVGPVELFRVEDRVPV